VADARIERLAALAVGVGANVQRDQLVGVTAETGNEAYARAAAEAAYRRGARYVDVRYFDSEVKRLRLAHAPEESLDFVPEWLGERIRELSRAHGANVAFVPNVTPGLLADADPRRAGKDRLPWLAETSKMVDSRTVNWTAVPAPSAAWARVVHGGADGALERLWADIERVLRLDEADPAGAWRERMAELDDVAAKLTQRRLDAIRFEGPGTDITIGLLPTSIWASALFTTVDGLQHLVNLPSEEVFTAPDPLRADGVVRSTRPLDVAGTPVEGLVVRFEHGRAVQIDADQGADVLRGRAAADDGACRLGEVALVDRTGRVGMVGTTFYDTLLDENAASHIALGNAYAFTVGDADRERLNHSAIHIDFMIGGDDVAVTGTTTDGQTVPLLRGGDWQI
jgi:aminopeptidase